jgi:UDP-3-O-[3-hydroxymyristoyl] glucosamine N-acyltransferase
MSNLFFKCINPIELNDLLKTLNFKSNETFKDTKIHDIKDLVSADKDSITFYHSKKYKDFVQSTKASYCITSENLKKDLPKSCKSIIVKNVLISTALITEKFYPNSINDDFDNDVTAIEELSFHKDTKHGNNILIGKNVKIGSNCSIGHNTLIEKNVIIGNNCNLGSNIILRNTIIKDNVSILDNCVIGKKGFGFFPIKNGNYRYPHIGLVEINDNCEIGCGATIDRGSLSNTVIGKNTFLDNQIHIAHNVKIGENCIIAGQVGIAGSSIIGKNVKIGGQAGISGHLKIGDNVEIGGGSGVIKSIPNNLKVMGYPAKEIKKFLKENR